MYSISYYSVRHYLTIDQDNAIYTLQAYNASVIKNLNYSSAPSNSIACAKNLECSPAIGKGQNPRLLATITKSAQIPADIATKLATYGFNIPEDNRALLHEFVEVYLNENVKDTVSGKTLAATVTGLVAEAFGVLHSCGSVTSPVAVGQQGPSYTVTAGQATRFTTTPSPKNGYPFGTYRWKTSEGAEILSTIEQANVTFTTAGSGSVTVTPVLADGTVCTGSAATSSVTVTNVGQFLPSIGSTTWKTVDFETNFTPIRINTLGRVECASDDGINCFWGTRAESMGNPSKPLVCTDVQHSDSDHWCGQIYALRNLTWTPNTSNGRYYGLANCGTWRMCASKADFLGVKMVTVRSLIENNWLVSNFPMTQHYWIGATNGGIVGAWRWVSGEAFGYSNWGNNLNNQGGNENCAHFYSVTPGFWNDLRCDSQDVKKAIVEYINSGTITVLANTIPGATLTVPSGASTCMFNSTGTWSAGPQAPPQYQNADGVIGGTSYNLTNFGVPMPAEANMALVVKHSSTGKWDLLGSSKTISVAAGETLSFMMNDATTFGYTDGNTGQLSTVWSCN